MAFRLFKHIWVGSDYSNHDADDVKDCIKKLIDPLVVGGCNWSWDTTHCPDNEPIKLKPSNRVYAAFIKHTSGAKAMIGYHLNGIKVASSTDGTCDNVGTWFDAGFLLSHIRTVTSFYVEKLTGLFFSFISADSVKNNGADFHPEYSTLDENFYDSEMLPITTLSYMIHNYSNYYDCPSYNSGYCSSMIKRITDGKQCEHYLMSDNEKPILFLGSRKHGNKLNCALFGEIATQQRRYDYDIRDTRTLRCLLGGAFSGIGGYGINPSEYDIGEDTQKPYAPSDSSTTKPGACELLMFSTDGTGTSTSVPRVLGYNWSTTTPRTASTIYDGRCVWDDSIRSIYPSGLQQGQVYANGLYVYIGGGDSGYPNSMGISRDGDSTSYGYGIVVPWDSEFNQANRFL